LGGGGGETHQQLGPAEGREFDGGDPSAVRRTCKQRRRDVLAQWRSSTSTVLTVTTKKKKKKNTTITTHSAYKYDKERSRDPQQFLDFSFSGTFKIRI
jgi:hypothetical protein